MTRKFVIVFMVKDLSNLNDLKASSINLIRLIELDKKKT